jgi:hypothetical protein
MGTNYRLLLIRRFTSSDLLVDKVTDLSLLLKSRTGQ